MEFAAAREHSQRVREQEITSCWMIAALSRATKLPPLQQLIGSRGVVQTVQEQKAALMLIFGHTGQPKAKSIPS